jgi:hypothetical protein
MNQKRSQKNRSRIKPAPGAQVHFSDAPNGLLGMAADLSNLLRSFEILAGDPANAAL